MNQTATTEIKTKTITIQGQTFEVPVSELADLTKNLGQDLDVKEAKKSLTKVQMAQKRKEAYDIKRAAEIEAHKNDQVWLAKEEQKNKNREKRIADKARAIDNKKAREARSESERTRIVGLISEAGSKLPVERIMKCEVKPYHAIGALRGYKSILTYTQADGAKVAKHNLFNLDVIGNGTTDDMKALAEKDLLNLLKTSK